MLPADPAKDPADDVGFLLDHVETRHALTGLATDKAVSVRCPPQNAHGTSLGQMALAAPAPLKQAGPLVLRKHSLKLQQQVVFRGLADGPVQEDDFRAGLGKLLDQDRLMRIAAGQAIGGMHVDEVHGLHGDEITQALQGGPNQSGAAVTIIEEAEGFTDVVTVGCGSCQQVTHLAVDGVLLSLLVGGDAGVDRRPRGRGGTRPGSVAQGRRHP